MIRIIKIDHVIARLDYLEACWRAGYAGYEQKKRCPYAKGTDARVAWQDGHRTAKRDYECDPPPDD